ncbi:MAG: hypothetical protein HUN04_17200 [Desulfobacter sp.]|nr:MAG: hypothetical protein HUN04_17200 [Desulfobacter sp.]
MDGQFKLYCEYIHCCGKKAVELGETESEKAAKQWCREQTIMKKRPKLPKTDLIRTCPVVHCPAKLQIPVYGYRKVTG